MDPNPIQYQRHQGPQNKFQSQPPNLNAQYLHRHHKTRIIKAQINRSRDKLNPDPTHNQQTRRQRLRCGAPNAVAGGGREAPGSEWGGVCGGAPRKPPRKVEEEGGGVGFHKNLDAPPSFSAWPCARSAGEAGGDRETRGVWPALRVRGQGSCRARRGVVFYLRTRALRCGKFFYFDFF
jgi:hypothetical protein